MKTIWKYVMHPHTASLSLPAASEVLSVTNQDDNMVLYALVDDAITTKEDWGICIVGTGHTISGKTTKFIGTVRIVEPSWPPMYFHVFVTPPYRG